MTGVRFLRTRDRSLRAKWIIGFAIVAISARTETGNTEILSGSFQKRGFVDHPDRILEKQEA
ncbi:MAG: hypothetical protein CL573_06455 [Alphaproteobacteria bacterium]|nr:hypothetical protein [Alphaproteobacteria bacterium]HCP00512.1 hypothetical protein [Rhodospirillaceae bacterium]